MGFVRGVVLVLTVLAGALAFAWWPSAPLPDGAAADLIVVNKSERTLTLLRQGAPLKTYHVSLGRQPIGRKLHEGDGRTPEGRYVIDLRNATSRFHLALRMSYPDASDRARARRIGKNPGGAIMIHGMKNGYGWIGRLHLLVDWTDGCIAVTDNQMNEIWKAVPIGTPVEILP